MQKNSVLQYLCRFFGSLLFSISLITITLVYGVLFLFSIPLPLRYRYALGVHWMHSALASVRILCGVKYQIEGLENIPPNRCGIVLSKHQSTWETFFLPGLFHQAAIILKKELLWIPFFGWSLACIEPIAINRKKKASAMEQVINQGRKCLAAGRWIIVYPEGTRTPVGTVGNYRPGGARLATATGHPVIPIAHNAGRYWPRKKFLKTPGTIRVVVGPLIETVGETPEAVLLKAKNWIEETLKKIDVE